MLRQMWLDLVETWRQPSDFLWVFLILCIVFAVVFIALAVPAFLLFWFLGFSDFFARLGAVALWLLVFWAVSAWDRARYDAQVQGVRDA